MPPQSLPLLDLSAAVPGSAEERRLAELAGRALTELGFFAVERHGVDSELIRRSYAAVEAFFTLPEERKRRYEDPQGKGQRGFTSFGREHARDHPAPDLKEFWHVGRDLPPGHPLETVYPANIWPTPEDAPGFDAALRELYRQIDACALRLLELVALYLDEPRDRFREMARDGNSILRIIHYPPVPPDADPASMRAAPHEDINLITLLCEATAGGLELLTREGEWLAVEAVPGQIIVDAGDMLQNATNGVLRSTTHRVVNPGSSRERRLSMPFFAHARPEVSVGPLPGCIARSGGERRYPEITAGDYLLQRLREIGLA
ncbi:MAG: isopenicillin N synthase family dioxygenase [Armatimonadota bacterium]